MLIEIINPFSFKNFKSLSTKVKASPGKTIFFTWSIKDPTAAGGPPDPALAAFESAYQSLESHIKELLAAILEEPSNESKS